MMESTVPKFHAQIIQKRYTTLNQQVPVALTWQLDVLKMHLSKQTQKNQVPMIGVLMILIMLVLGDQALQQFQQNSTPGLYRMSWYVGVLPNSMSDH